MEFEQVHRVGASLASQLHAQNRRPGPHPGRPFRQRELRIVHAVDAVAARSSRDDQFARNQRTLEREPVEFLLGIRCGWQQRREHQDQQPQSGAHAVSLAYAR
jgi:hypothetical protein